MNCLNILYILKAFSKENPLQLNFWISENKISVQKNVVQKALFIENFIIDVTNKLQLVTKRLIDNISLILQNS